MLEPRIFNGLRKRQGYPEEIRTVGDQIKTERLKRGLFQKDVANLLHVDISTITGWERNDHLPHISMYPHIEKFLGYPPIHSNLNQIDSVNQLLALRLKAGLTQKDAARLLGIHHSTLGDYENMRGREKNSEHYIELAKRLF